MMFRFLRKLRNDSDGATAVEYGLIAGLISVVIITALQVVNSTMISVFDYISTSISNAIS
jgi:pilus assembly protein Flp/PilA